MVTTADWSGSEGAVAFLLAAAGAFVTCGLSVSLGHRLHVLDAPSERGSHTLPTPRIGGAGMVLVVLAIGFWVLSRSVDASVRTALQSLLIGMALVGGVSLWDDFYSASPRYRYWTSVWVKFVAMFAGAAIAIGHGSYLRLAPLSPTGAGIATVLGIALTALWIVGFANVYNFMDGINGIASGSGVIFSVVIAVLAFSFRAGAIGVMALALGGACFGFLFHNFPNARIFMGDVGAITVGYALAVLTAMLVASGGPTLAIPCVLVVGPFVYDTVFSIVRKWRLGEPIFRPHRTHLYQRLVISGLAHATVSGIYFLLAAASGALALAYAFGTAPSRLVAVATAGVLFAGHSRVVARREETTSRGRDALRPEHVTRREES